MGGKNYLKGEEDYATWHTKLLLQGCMTFDLQTSQQLKCSDTDGITFYNYNVPNCDGGSASTDFEAKQDKFFDDGLIQCNYGTGRSVYCFDDVTTADPTTKPSNSPTTMAPITAMPTSADPTLSPNTDPSVAPSNSPSIEPTVMQTTTTTTTTTPIVTAASTDDPLVSAVSPLDISAASSWNVFICLSFLNIIIFFCDQVINSDNMHVYYVLVMFISLC